jgi:hypothetical protein
MKDGLAKDFTKQTFLSSSITEKIQCLLQEIHTNLCERNHKVVNKHEGV